MNIAELDVLRWLPILAMVYWLGGEWGVFQTSYNIVNRALSLDERRQYMETACRIHPRTITALPVSPTRQCPEATPRASPRASRP